MARVFEGSFRVTVGQAKHEVCKVVTRVSSVELESTLRAVLQRLRFTKVQPTEPSLDLVCSLAPRNVIPQLVAVGGVFPGTPVLVIDISRFADDKNLRKNIVGSRE